MDDVRHTAILPQGKKNLHFSVDKDGSVSPKVERSEIFRSPSPGGHLLPKAAESATHFQKKQFQFLQHTEFYMLRITRNVLQLAWEIHNESTSENKMTYLFTPLLQESVAFPGLDGLESRLSRRNQKGYDSRPPLSVLLSLINYCITHLKSLYQTKSLPTFVAASYLVLITPDQRQYAGILFSLGVFFFFDHHDSTLSWTSIEGCLWDVFSLAYLNLLFECEAYWKCYTAQLKRYYLKYHQKILKSLNERIDRFYASTTTFLNELHSDSELPLHRPDSDDKTNQTANLSPAQQQYIRQQMDFVRTVQETLHFHHCGNQTVFFFYLFFQKKDHIICFMYTDTEQRGDFKTEFK
ncbi:hypothetical protein RFI_18414 [Reticulomyxa filosa]|uniref:Uncharacterized protein n=1 Tax=Reticulomyxa filosa TaxID=46433 RepID=X6MXS0_RETFI|nr:hypothetical protein RFI_18414 [Reticulomyxa filosa]|eukprot:ETO18830.1 hypothetical protein RFI_18414 [Reticulomyxa filosa]